jgi:tetratricopeptide (TPR) repeat protein
VESGRRALAIASSLGDAELEMVANLRLGQVYFARGDYRQTVETCRACLQSRKGELLREGFGLPAIPAVISLGFMGRSLALLGDFPTGIATTAEAIRVAEAAAHPYSVVVAYWASGDTYVARGDHALAIPVLERARALSDEQSFTLMVPIVGRTLGEAYALAGRPAEALSLLQGAVDGLEAMKYMPALPPAHGSLGESLLLAGRLPEALRAAQLSLDLCRAHRQRGNEAYALRVLGEIHAAQDPPANELAEAAYLGALSIATEVGNRPLAARCELGLGKLYRSMGNSARAAQHLASAVSALRALEMPRWLREAEQLLR